MNRNLSPQRMFQDMAREHRPQCAFSGNGPDDVETWKTATWPMVLATLGDFPPAVAANPELIAEWEHDGLRKQRSPDA